MSISGLFNQTITKYAQSTYTADGRRTFAAGSTIKARVQRVNKRRLLPDSSIVVISLIAYIEATNTVSTDDKITYDGQDYVVYSVIDQIGEDGTNNHIKLELTLYNNG